MRVAWGGWFGKTDFNVNPVVSLDLDFGLRLRVCQFRLRHFDADHTLSSPIPAEPKHECECQHVPPKFDASYDDKVTVADLIDFTSPAYPTQTNQCDVNNQNDDELVQPSPHIGIYSRQKSL